MENLESNKNRYDKSGEKDNSWMERVNPMLGVFSDTSQACDLDEIPQGFGRFGLEVSNPVPICGVPENRAYLSRLRLASGENFTWKRLGSSRTENIENPIDIYLILDENGNEICSLYLSPYHLKTSQKAPEGFILLLDKLNY